MKVPPVKYIVKIKDMYLAAFIQYWIEYDKPCKLLWRKPNTNGFTGVIVVIDNDDAVMFLARAKENLSFEIIRKEP